MSPYIITSYCTIFSLQYLFKVAFTNNNNACSIIKEFLLERLYYWNVFLFNQSKKKKEEKLNRSQNESYYFSNDEKDLDIDTADEEVSSTKDNDYEDQFNDLISSEKRKYSCNSEATVTLGNELF